MNQQAYRNKAFISYRHTGRDSRIAALLQRELENYRLPRGLDFKKQAFSLSAEQNYQNHRLPQGLDGQKEKTGALFKSFPAERNPRRLGRIFRDTTDLGARADLTAELRRELEDSEYMIVLCSTASAESVWVEREIRYFLQTHPAERILPVLIDGEPEQVLPAMFDRFGEMPQHPLACDFRERTGEKDTEENLQIFHLIRGRIFRSDHRDSFSRAELTRLAAALLDCPYDMLANRRKRYETRRRAAVLGATFLLLAVVTIYYAMTSARIRQSYRDQLVAESESLAVRSETALAGQQRFDAIRYALKALPEKKGDRPVTGQSVLALQKAVTAYVPEGNRRTEQTAELAAPGRIQDYEVCRGDDAAYVCAVYGSGDVILWNADTGEVLFDSGAGVEKDDSSEASTKEEGAGENAGENAFQEDREMYDMTAYDVSVHLTQELLVFAKGWTLTAVETRTGKLLWQAEEERNIKLTVFDEKAGAIALEARGIRQDILPVSDSKERENEFTPGEQVGEQVLELQLRSTADGSLIYRRNAGQEENPDTTFFVNASFTGNRHQILLLKGADDQFSLQLLDPETKQEKTLAQERCIIGYYLTDNGRILAASYETLRDNIKGFKSGTGNREIRYKQKGTEPLSIFCIDLKSGKEKWRTLTSCTQNCNICLSGDLEIASAGGRKVCLATAGSHMEILAQDTGQCLYTYDLPGLPVSWSIGEGRSLSGDTGEALVSALRDGSQVFCFFEDSEISKYESIFPGQVLEAKEAGGLMYFLCGQEDGTGSSDRILVVGESVFDPEGTYLLDACGDPIHLEELRLRYGDSTTDRSLIGSCIVAGDKFILIRRKENSDSKSERGNPAENKSKSESGDSAENKNKSKSGDSAENKSKSESGDSAENESKSERGNPAENESAGSTDKENVIVTAVDACTGEIRWETELGANLSYAGYARQSGTLVFQDNILSGWELYQRSMNREKKPEPVWNFLHVEDGHVDTVRDIEKNIFGGKAVQTNIMKAGGSSVFLYAAPEEEGEIWLLNYSLSDGATDKIRIPEEYLDTVRAAYFPSQIAIDPDGNLAVYAFGLSEYTDEGEEIIAKINLLVDWKTHKIRELENTPMIDGPSVVTWSRDGKQIAFLRYDRKAFLVSRDGEMLYRSSEASASSARIHGIGFRQKDLFLLEEEDFDLHFRIPEKEIDILLPAGKNVQFDQDIQSEKEYFSWDLPGHKLLLQYGMQSFIFDLETGITEAVIDNMVAYNPQADTLLLTDDDGHMSIFPRYGWEDLAEKGKRILGEDPAGK